MTFVDHVEYDMKKAKGYFRHAALAADRIHKRDMAHQTIAEQISNVKKAASDKKALNKELKKLEENLAVVLKTQKIVKQEGESFKKYQQIINRKVAEMERKLDDFIKSSDRRGQRLKDLESSVHHRISGKETDRKAALEMIEKLEKKHRALEKERVSASRLKAIDERIKNLKKKL